MTDTTKNILLFIGGVIWAMKSSKKAYAPPLTTNNQILPSKPVVSRPPVIPMPNPKSQNDCQTGHRFYPDNGLMPSMCAPNCQRPSGFVKTPSTTPGVPFDCREPMSQSDCSKNKTFTAGNPNKCLVDWSKIDFSVIGGPFGYQKPFRG